MKRGNLKTSHLKTWKVFSRFIRRRDCLKTTGTLTRGKCTTCGREYPIGKLDAGHFQNKKMHSNLRYDEMNVNAQCTYCNRYQHGALDKYTRALDGIYGRKKVDDLIDRGRITKKWTISELDELRTYYEKRLTETS